MSLHIGPYRFEPRLLTSLLALVVFALLVSLGRWQLGRADEKAALLDSRAAAESAGVVELSSARLASPAELEHRRASATGVLDLARQYLLDNQVHKGVAGYHVLTPLRTAPGPTSTWVVVNRGWVPVGATRDVLPELPGPAGPVTVQGALAGPPSTGILLGDPGYGATGWPRVVQTVDLDAMSEELDVPLHPLLLRLAPEAVAGFVREWPAIRGLPPERHHGYAFQWFSLATALLVIYVVVNTRRSDRS